MTERKATAGRCGIAIAGNPIVISIGSNLAGPFGSPHTSCRRAVAEIAALPFLSGCDMSAWYVTEPVPKSMQPNFINGVATFIAAFELDPAWLLRHLQQIEARAGRVRHERNGPRTLDLDIVAMGDLVRDQPDPILPHPRMHERRFVIEPLRDLLPAWRHPVLGLDVDALLASLPPENTRRLAAGEAR